MKASPNHSVESLYRQHQLTLVGYVHRSFPSLSSQAFDIVQEVFIKLQMRGTGVLGEISLAALTKHTWQKAEDRRRMENRIKRGSGKVSSLDRALESIDLEPVAPNASYLETVEELEIVDRVLAEAKPILSERELILARIIRSNLPDELSIIEISLKMTPMQRQRFLPVRRCTSLEEAEAYIVRQISRSKASLQQKLREVRSEMGL